jgi:hypothetical protein
MKSETKPRPPTQYVAEPLAVAVGSVLFAIGWILGQYLPHHGFPFGTTAVALFFSFRAFMWWRRK